MNRTAYKRSDDDQNNTFIDQIPWELPDLMGNLYPVTIGDSSTFLI